MEEFHMALKQLGISEYAERIFKSNSHGELFHLDDYILLAKEFKDEAWFSTWFKEVVKMAEESWSRPESVFQHIPEILNKCITSKSL
jgi:hypothetical protein